MDAPAAEPPRPAPRRPWWRKGWLAWVVLLAVLIGIVVFRFRELKQLTALVAHIDGTWLALALLLQVITYVCTPLIWQRVLARAGPPPTLWRLLPLALAKLFVDNAFPTGGVSGTAVVVERLGRRGVTRPQALAAVLVDLLSYYIAYATAVITTLLVLALRQKLVGFVMVLAGVFALFALLVPLAIFRLTSPRSRPPAWALRVRPLARLMTLLAQTPRELVRSPALLSFGAVLRLAIFVLDAATLAVMLRALGVAASPGTVFAGFIVGSLAGTVGPLPGGLGSFEAGAVATLVLLGVRAQPALAGTLLTRGLTFWAPMLPGFLLLRHDLGASLTRDDPGLNARSPPAPAG
jgi:uncharacterized protein (TIRG00374 family)